MISAKKLAKLVLNSETIARMNITPPHLQHSHGENSPQLSGLPASADRATRLGEVPHFTCERNQEIKRDCMERLVTPPKRGTSPTWGPPPPCEQALSLSVRAKKPYRNPENLISAGLPTGDHYALKSGKLVYLLTLIPLVLRVRYVYISSVGGERLSVHLARQLQNRNNVPYLLERV